jgi:aryl-alcohol dehydrogenase-like predicted oxidoreductase
MGILTGKLKRDSEFGEGDFRRKWQTEPEQLAVYERDLASVAELQGLVRDGRTLAQAALQFTLAHPAVTTVIPGARNARQVSANIAAAAAPSLHRNDWALIDRVTAPGGGRKIWPA